MTSDFSNASIFVLRLNVMHRDIELINTSQQIVKKIRLNLDSFNELLKYYKKSLNLSKYML